MDRFERVRRWLTGGVNLAASLVTLIPLVVAAGGSIAGYVVPALAIALAISLVGNVYLWSQWRHPRRFRRKPKPTKWLPDPSDLRTLAFAKSDFEEAYERAKGAAQSAYGPDAEPAFVAFTLLPRPYLHFLAHSAAASRHGDVDVTDDDVQVSPGKRLAPGRGPVIAPKYPWRENETWRQLVEASWLLVRPFNGYVSMQWSWNRVTKDRDQRGVWEISYDAHTEDVQEPTVTYQLAEDGRAVRVR